MYIKKEEFKAIAETFKLLPRGEDFEKLTEEEQNNMIKAEVALIKAIRRQKEDNKKTWERIKEKRKTNKNYGRPKREWTK